MKIDLTEGTIAKMELGSQYIILFNEQHISEDDCATLNKILREEFGVHAVTCLIRGVPSEMKIIKLPESRRKKFNGR